MVGFCCCSVFFVSVFVEYPFVFGPPLPRVYWSVCMFVLVFLVSGFVAIWPLRPSRTSRRPLFVGQLMYSSVVVPRDE